MLLMFFFLIIFYRNILSLFSFFEKYIKLTENSIVNRGATNMVHNRFLKVRLISINSTSPLRATCRCAMHCDAALAEAIRNQRENFSFYRFEHLQKKVYVRSNQ